MNDTKTAVSSVGVWSSSILGGAGIFEIFQEIINSNSLPAGWHPYLLAIGGLLSLVGRLRAKKKIEGLV